VIRTVSGIPTTTLEDPAPSPDADPHHHTFTHPALDAHSTNTPESLFEETMPNQYLSRLITAMTTFVKKTTFLDCYWLPKHHPFDRGKSYASNLYQDFQDSLYDPSVSFITLHSLLFTLVWLSLPTSSPLSTIPSQLIEYFQGSPTLTNVKPTLTSLHIGLKVIWSSFNCEFPLEGECRT